MTKKNSQEKILREIKHGGVKSLVKKALEEGIGVQVFWRHPFLLKFTWRKRDVIIRGETLPVEKRMGNVTKDKNITKLILKNAGIKTSKGIVASSFKEAKLLVKAKKLRLPLIAKPLSDSLSRNVTWEINSFDQLKKAVSLLLRRKKKENRFQKKPFLVEEMFAGEEFRVLVFEGKVVSCVKKMPASVMGDNFSSIKKLIEDFNLQRAQGYEIKIDKVVRRTLKEKKLSLNSVLPKGYCLKLRPNPNMSDGGRAIECTSLVDKKFKLICQKASEVLGLKLAGIDFLAKDITDKKSQYVIIEVNSNPYYNMHEKPLVEGKGIDFSWQLLKKLFPEIKPN